MRRVLFKSKFHVFVLLFCTGALLFTGCRSLSGEKRRLEESTYFREKLRERTATYEEKYQGEVSLEDCWEIARQESIPLRSQDLSREISRLQRHIAFANFLPVVEAEMDYTAWHRQPATDISDMDVTLFDRFVVPLPIDYLPLHDKRMRNAAVSAHMPLFVPKTWFLYSMRRRGEEIENLLHDLTEQMVYLQLVSQYYHCLSLQHSIDVLKTQLDAVENLYREASDWYEEGLILSWELEEIEIMVRHKENALQTTERRLEEALGELWMNTGLSPSAPFQLQESEPYHAFDWTEKEQEELILKALLENPRMYIHDHEVDIQEDQVKIAITRFLPEISGFARYEGTSNEMARYSTNYLWGVAGVLTIFDGFANINEYRAARRRAEQTYLQREEAGLSLMLQVIKAYNRLQDSLETQQIMKKSLSMQESHLATKEAEFSEGMITLSELLQARAKRDQAKMNKLNSRYQVQVSKSMMNYLVGAPIEEDSKRSE